MTAQSDIPVWGLLVVFATILIGSCKLFGPDFVAAHDDAIIKCDYNLKVDHVTKIGEVTFANGLVDEHYDRNDDGMTDIHALSYLIEPTDLDGLVPHQPNPILWQVDLDFDGEIDKVYIDIYGEGRCEDIKLYLDRNLPLPPEMFHGYDPLMPEELGDDHELPRGGHL